ncbi:MAG: GDSL family lipase [Ruminiclostridium sp.]|nr:GDSL family lipase [Ruminiclostridium sp.]
MKKFGTVVLAAALAATSLTGCSEGGNDKVENTSANNGTVTTTEDTASPNGETSYTASAKNVKMLGRTAYLDDDVLYCAFSGTGIEFTFTGTKCSITVVGDSGSTNSGNADSQARVGIYVDGERVIDDMVDQAEEVYNVIDSDAEVTATVSLVKLSETANSIMGIKEIKVVGSEIKPTANKDLLIEFVGDSITCGYGVDDPDKDHHFSTKTEDITKAYGYKTAQKMDADYSMVSLSGYGIISGYSGDGKKVPAQTLPQYYDKLGYSWNVCGSFSPSAVEWDFSKRQPDLIVITLGTNDDRYTKDNQELQEEYSAAYTEFIKQVREKNPDAKILCALGVMGDTLYPYVEKAVERYAEETGDKDSVFAVKLSPQSASNGYAADWHPSEATHEATAKAVVREIKKILG